MLAAVARWFVRIRTDLREDGEARFGRHGSFWHRFSLSRWRWGMTLCKFDDHWSLHLFCLWITLWRTRNPPEDMLDKWGWDYYPEERYLALSWGSKTRHIDMPWAWEHGRTEILMADGTWTPDTGPDRHTPISERRAPISVRCLPYKYTLQSGEVQHRMATIIVKRGSFCWKWWPFRIWRWPVRHWQSIQVDFDQEVGEETGSYKGGTIGCGYNMLPGETPEQCLRRMESERTF